ncbi:hypothetical protein O3G_MSEX011415 [Manduca sexta]|uniref:Secreted protein n=1 Tax=Manduca sexta TaxID=7130 RepID=A0A922CV71_MANSE|nr:hypothetical protein O3G_MSEX011415 [Manduca sexta]
MDKMLFLVGALYLHLAVSSLETLHYCKMRLLDVPIDYRNFYVKLCVGQESEKQYARYHEKDLKGSYEPTCLPYFNIDLRPTLPPWRPTLPNKHKYAAQQLSSQIYDNLATSTQTSFVSFNYK